MIYQALAIALALRRLVHNEIIISIRIRHMHMPVGGPLAPLTWSCPGTKQAAADGMVWVSAASCRGMVCCRQLKRPH